MNCKGSDTMLCLKWLVVQCAAFENDVGNGADKEFRQMMKSTSKAAVDVFSFVNSHGLFYEKKCAITLDCEITRFINGFSMLANKSLNSNQSLWGLKPKLHLKHTALDLHHQLSSQTDFF